LVCETAHNFDRAKEGYWNLTQPQDKKSSNPGDIESAVLARSRWLRRGHAKGLIDLLAQLIDDQGLASGRVVDLGCGEGTFGSALFKEHADSFCGIDLSRKAIKLASRNWPEATWVLANADRQLPIADSSVNLVMSLFGRRPSVEIGRVLSEGGTLVVAVPGEEDLIELREHVQRSGELRSRWAAVVEEMKVDGLELVEHRSWKQTIDLGPDEIADALAMTYRAARHSEQERLSSVSAMEVTQSADLLLFRHSD
jgi:23S rRNA (guanine745-N1)-methyltransferase